MKEENQTIIKTINMFGRVPEQYELLEEIERLNNIIDEFEKWLIKQQIEEGEYCDFLLENKQIKVEEVLDKLQELKGDDK